MATIVETVKGCRKGLMASRTEIALMSVGHFAMLMSFSMTAQRTLHHLVSSEGLSLLYQFHTRLMHYPRLVRKTLSFSKFLENHIGAIWYFVHHYNASLPV